MKLIEAILLKKKSEKLCGLLYDKLLTKRGEKIDSQFLLQEIEKWEKAFHEMELLSTAIQITNCCTSMDETMSLIEANHHLEFLQKKLEGYRTLREAGIWDEVLWKKYDRFVAEYKILNEKIQQATWANELL